MNIKIIIYKIFLIFIVSSCASKVDKGYYSNGVLRYEERLIDENKKQYLLKSYFENGNPRFEGTAIYIDRKSGRYIPDGFCKEYYSDGILKWEGTYDSGHIDFMNLKEAMQNKDTAVIIDRWFRIADSIDIDIKLDKSVEVGKTYKIRVIAPYLHYHYYTLTNANGKELQSNADDPECYPYIVTIDKSYGGYFPIYLTYTLANGDILNIDGNDHYGKLFILKVPQEEGSIIDSTNWTREEKGFYHYMKEEERVKGDYEYILEEL